MLIKQRNVTEIGVAQVTVCKLYEVTKVFKEYTHLHMHYESNMSCLWHFDGLPDLICIQTGQ